MHYPTDINLLYDATRKTIQQLAILCDHLGLTELRQHQYTIRSLKKLYNKARKLKHSTSKDEEIKAIKKQELNDAHERYVSKAKSIIMTAKALVYFIQGYTEDYDQQLAGINTFISYAELQIDLILRRVIKGEKIPHHEKIFSVFEPHTEWISKGKAGVPQELGLRVSIMTDQHGFILHHRVMQNETDDKVAVLMVVDTQKKYPNLTECSFDKGYYSPKNIKALSKILDHLTMPKKGRLSAKDKEHEHSEYFVRSKMKHSAVESNINALEIHGLDRCPDRGIKGFKRYVGLAVLGRNIQILGHNLQQKIISKKRHFIKIAA